MSLKTKIYPCGGTYIYIDVPSEEASPPPALSTVRAGVPGKINRIQERALSIMHKEELLSRSSCSPEKSTAPLDRNL